GDVGLVGLAGEEGGVQVPLIAGGAAGGQRDAAAGAEGGRSSGRDRRSGRQRVDRDRRRWRRSARITARRHHDVVVAGGCCGEGLAGLTNQERRAVVPLVARGTARG